jgi:hypothetical protein
MPSIMELFIEEILRVPFPDKKAEEQRLKDIKKHREIKQQTMENLLKVLDVERTEKELLENFSKLIKTEDYNKRTLLLLSLNKLEESGEVVSIGEYGINKRWIRKQW